MDYKRQENETEEQYLWRIGQAKDNGLIDIDWIGIADIMNKEFREDETDYRHESAYRKFYQYAKKMFDAGVFSKQTEDNYINDLIATQDAVRKEKQKLFDERKALNKISRDHARAEEDFKNLENMIRENGKYSLPEIHNKLDVSDNDMIVSLSDFHLGLEFCNGFGFYNAEVAEERLCKYLEKIIKIRNTHNSENAYLVLLGDSVNGTIHWTTQLQNRENLVEQIQKCAEMVSAFTYELSKYFKNVYVAAVPGNHSRIGLKDHVMRDERVDGLIPWYMQAKLSHLKNVKFIKDKFDETIGVLHIRDYVYCYVHGDFDKFSEAGVAKLVMMLGFKPAAILYGHLHHCSYDDISGVKIIRSGSFCGTGDDFTVSRRISGKPQQMVVIADDTGVRACYPVDLD